MRRLNAAFDAILADVTPGHRPAGAGGSADRARRRRRRRRRRPCRGQGHGSAHDVASFTIEALPAEAFEALLVVASWLGDVVDDDPPYRLDVVLGEPLVRGAGWSSCPDAGASTVAVTLGAIDAGGVPDIDVVRDVWVAALNSLGPEQPA